MTDAADGDPAGEAVHGGDRPDGPATSSDEPLGRRVVEQFSDAGDRAAVWRGFERFLPTAEYLNLGYSPRYWPTLVGDSQARLAARLADGLVDRTGNPAGAPLLDLGCGRGGPARQFAARGFAVTGLDLVPYNVSLARANAGAGDASGGGRRPRFIVGDATALPFADDAFAACVAVDSLVYLPEEAPAFAEVGRVVADGGWLAASTLLAAADGRPTLADARPSVEDARPSVEDARSPAESARSSADDALAAFASAWDTAPPRRANATLGRLRAAGFAVETVEDVTPNSLGRFRKWSRLFLALADGPAGGILRSLLRRWDVDPDATISRVRAADRALPHLRHVVVYARVAAPGES